MQLAPNESYFGPPCFFWVSENMNVFAFNPRVHAVGLNS